MFTGLIQQVGKVRRVSRGAGLVLELEFEPWPQPLAAGESVAVNGVCLTLARFDERHFTAEVLAETERCSTLGELTPGRRVNLERAVRAGERLGGHLVQGHVDGVGTVAEVLPRGRDVELRVRCSRVLAAQSVLKGSIAVDGVSLTISALGNDFIAVNLIPTTRRDTTLGALRVGERVNLEADIVTKYLAGRPEARPGLTEAQLAAAGFI